MWPHWSLQTFSWCMTWSRHMAHSLKPPSLMRGGVADGLMRVWRSRVVSPATYRIGETVGSCIAASAAGLIASAPAALELT
eukprot:6360017-Pyramimonas_sp.AAC.1